jgi:uncharacterized protein (DUF362 family)
MEKSVVAISKEADVEKMVADVLGLLGGTENLIRPRSTIVLKPNAGHPAAAETSVNTSPGLVVAVINEVKKAKPKDIIVAESAAIGCETFDVFEKSGIGAAAESAGARLIDIKSVKDLISIPIRDARSDIKKMKLPRFLLEAEHIINLPIFKSHASMVFTCALKNLKGVVQDVTHQQMHNTDLAAAMMDLWSVIRPDLSIADLIRPAEGFGPHTTLPIEFGCVVGSKDPVALDATACRMTGLALEKVAYFAAGASRRSSSSCGSPTWRGSRPGPSTTSMLKAPARAAPPLSPSRWRSSRLWANTRRTRAARSSSAPNATRTCPKTSIPMTSSS